MLLKGGSASACADGPLPARYRYSLTAALASSLRPCCQSARAGAGAGRHGGWRGLPFHDPVQQLEGFFGIAAIRFNGRERGGGPPGNGVHAFGGELVQRREDRGGIVQTPPCGNTDIPEWTVCCAVPA